MEQITIDLVPMGVAANAHATQFDVNRGIRFNLKNGGTTYTLAGTETITIEMVKPDGSEQTISLTNTSSTYVDWITADGELDQAGVYSAEISVKQGDDVLGSRNFFVKTEPDPYNGKNIRTITVGPADICTFETNLPEPYQSVLVNVLATGGNGTPDNPNPINGYTEANIVNTQNDSIVDLFSIDSDFRGTVDFNQIVYDGNFSESPSVWLNSSASTNLVISDGIATYEATANYAQIATPSKKINVTLNHKYLCGVTAKASTNRSIAVGSTNIGYSYKAINTEFSRVYSIRNASATILEYPIIVAYSTVSGDIISVKDAVIIDLTQMFGSTIADYIYSLEQNNAGAGVAFFRSIYPEDYYSYDLGTKEIVGKETPEAVISFGQTVYGGVLDVTRGKVRVDKAYKDLGTLNYTMYSVAQGNLFRSDEFDVKRVTSTTEVPDIISSIFVAVASANRTNYTISMTNNTARIDVIDDDYSDEVAFKSAMSGVQLVYPLETPFDIDLTPEVISAIVGTNNVFADCGQTEVKYLAEG